MSSKEKLESKLDGLYARRNSGIKFGLDVQRALMGLLGDPQNNYACIHVAGTNGKGSVSAMLSQVLRGLGFRTGLYTSPHLVEFNERIVVDGVRAADNDLVRISDLIDSRIDEVRRQCGREPTFFEYATAMAMQYFAEQKAQLVVLETGMGGRLDATNIVDPMVSVITRIGLEHQEFLGADLESIAGEKAGIIKRGRAVVCGLMPEEARMVVKKRADELGCLFRDVEESVSIEGISSSSRGQQFSLSTDTQDYGKVEIQLLGDHQLENCSTAVASLEEVARVLGMAFGPDDIKNQLKQVRWTGRGQIISEAPPVILDGAHNAEGAKAITATLKKVFPGKAVALVVGMCSDKDCAAFLRVFRGARKAWAVRIRNERAVESSQLAEVARASGIDCESASLGDAIAAAKEWATVNDAVVCIAGSLFLAGEVLGLMESDE